MAGSLQYRDVERVEHRAQRSTRRPSWIAVSVRLSSSTVTSTPQRPRVEAQRIAAVPRSEPARVGHK